MDNRIKVLDENTANKIAAGEVVERPASVVKELVENSVDAGSSRVEVWISGGGIELIKVSDNGYGMSEEDAELSLVRHATSKIREIEDLDNINSLGFRGEALPSIASVSKFKLVTRKKDLEFAVQISVAGGKNKEVEHVGAGVGTVIKVEDLFFNVPARRKFLKTLSTEGNHVADVMSKMALAHPKVAFKLYNNGREVLSTTGSGDLQDVIFSLHGDKIVNNLLEIDYESTAVKVSGCIGKAGLYKSNRAWQYIFVNERAIGSRVVAKALDNAYNSVMPRGKYPFAVINITVASDAVDVNVHPQKSEVRFCDESAVYKAVYGAVIRALNSCFDAGAGEHRLAVAEQFAPNQAAREADNFVQQYMQIDFTDNITVAEPAAVSLASTVNKQKMLMADEVEAVPLPMTIEEGTGEIKENEQELVAGEYKNEICAEQVPANINFAEKKEILSAAIAEEYEAICVPQVVGQFASTYIIAQTKEELYLFDQHALHERLLYDSLKNSLGRVGLQPFIVPVFVNLPQDECEFLLTHKDEMATLGLEFDSAGEDVLRFESLPADIKTERLGDVIGEIVKHLEKEVEVTPELIRHVVWQTVACKKAVKAGEILSLRQMQIIVDEFFTKQSLPTCPHGRPLLKIFALADCEKMFGRR